MPDSPGVWQQAQHALGASTASIDSRHSTQGAGRLQKVHACLANCCTQGTQPEVLSKFQVKQPNESTWHHTITLGTVDEVHAIQQSK